MVTTRAQARARVASQKKAAKARIRQKAISRVASQKKAAKARIASRGRGVSRPTPTGRAPTAAQVTAATTRSQQQGTARARVERQKAEAQQRIASRRISGQATAPAIITPQRGALTISAFKPQEFQLESGFRRGPGEATRAFVTERIPKFVTGLGRAIGPAILGDTRQLREIDPFQAFTDVGPRRGERRVSVPQFGTVTPESRGGFIQTTQFDLLRQARRGAGVSEEFVGVPIGVVIRERVTGAQERITQQFQQRVDLGELSPELATKAAQIRVEREVGRQTAPLVGLGGETLRVRRGERISGTVKGLLPAVGLTALSFTPSGAIVSGGLSIAGGSFLATRGRGKIEEGDIAGGIADIGSGALFAAGGFAALGGAAGRLESQILASRVGRLQQQQFTITGRELARQGDDVLLGVTGRRGIGDFARQQTRSTFIVAPTTRTPAGLQRFSVIGGRTQTRTIVEGLPIRAGGFGTPSAAPIFRDISSATFTARAQVVPSASIRFGQDFSILLPKGEFIPSRGVLNIVRGDRVISSPFVGITQPTKDTFRIIGGRAQRAIIERPLRGFIGQPSITVRGGITQVGSIQRLPTGRSITPGAFQILGRAPKPPKIPSASFRIVGPAPRTPRFVDLSNIIEGPILGLPTSRSIAPGAFQIIGRAPQPSNIINIGKSLQKSLQTQATGIGATVGKEVVLRTPVIGLAPSVGVTPFAPLISTRAPTRTQQQAGQINIQSPKLTQIVDTTTRSAFLPDAILRSATSQRSRSASDIAQITQPAVATRLRSPQASRPVQRGIAPAVIIPTITPDVGFLGAVGTGFGFSAGFPSPLFPAFPSGRVPVRGRKRRPGRVAPSLTGITLFELGDITGGPLPTSGLPLTSFVPGSAVTRKKKKKSKKKK